MGALTRTDQELTHALTRSLGSMEQARRVAGVISSEMVRTHTYSTQKVAETLTRAQGMIDQAGTVTPIQRSLIQYSTRAYLSDMLQISDGAANSIVYQLTQLTER